VQQPRIPIWLAGVWPHKRPFRRAAQWDGVFPIAEGEAISPQDVRDMLAYIQPHRPSDAPFDVVVGERAYDWDSADRAARLAGYAAAGVTWWLEAFYHDNPLDEVRTRIHQGPPGGR
jgi:hypothetical protein